MLRVIAIITTYDAASERWRGVMRSTAYTMLSYTLRPRPDARYTALMLLPAFATFFHALASLRQYRHDIATAMLDVASATADSV